MLKNQVIMDRDFNMYKKQAQLLTAINQELDMKYIRNILEEDYDIHYKLPPSTFLKLWKPNLINNSALDFVVGSNIDSLIPIYKIKILEVLLEYGANFLQKDSEASTIIHKVLNCHFDLFKQIFDGQVKDYIIDLILSIHIKTNNATNPRNKNGISHFHIACVVNNVEAAEFFLKNETATISDRVDVESPNYAGYSPLHFAARFYSHDVAKMLLKRNANLYIEDANRMSPLQVLVDLSIKSTCLVNTDLRRASFNYEEFIGVGKMIDSILKIANENLEVNFIGNSGFTLLHAASAMNDISMVEYYLSKGYDVNAAVYMESPMWPGYTALHFAAHFNTDIMMFLRENGGNIDAKDSKGVTPFDIIATRFTIEDIHNILSSHPTWKNILLSDGKMKLIDLVWAMREVRELTAFLDSTNIDVNLIVPIESPLWPGNSLLHLAVLFLETHIIDSEEQTIAYVKRIILLMDRGADINIQNTSGLTAWQFVSHLDNSIISYLCERLQPSRFLSSDVDSSLGYSHMPWETRVIIGIEGDEEWAIPFYEEFTANIDQQKKMQEKIGLTMLHVACWKLKVGDVKDILKEGKVDVNAQIFPDSVYWPGYTSLHLLMEKYSISLKNEDKINTILQLLLENGANVNLTNTTNATPVHLTEFREELSYRMDDTDCCSNTFLKFCDSPFADILLKHLTNFNLESKDCHGISHFHIACIRNNVDVIQQFLEHGVDVNEPVDYFSDKYPGHTPLHLAMIRGPFVDASSRLKTVELLLLHGANVNLDDSNGNNPLHAAAKSTVPREDVLELLISFGANINAKNVLGETALEALLLTKDFTIPEIQVFIKRGYEIYNFNPLSQKGYLSAFCHNNSDTEIDLRSKSHFPNALHKVLDITKLDSSGRTIIHNIISDDKSDIGLDLLEYFIDQGCDIDHRDNLGRTALHIAVEFQNLDMVIILLNVGADINIVDTKGESPFSFSLKLYDDFRRDIHKYHSMFDYYWLENEQLPKIIQTFAKHVYKMKICGFYVSDHIADIQKTVMGIFDVDDCEVDNFSEQLDKIKNIKFGDSTVTAYDFLSISSRVMVYRIASTEICYEIDEFFKFNCESSLQENLNEVLYFVKVLYRKTLRRLAILQSAAEALQKLIGFSLPELCFKAIFVCLGTEDLKNLTDTMA